MELRNRRKQREKIEAEKKNEIKEREKELSLGNEMRKIEH